MDGVHASFSRVEKALMPELMCGSFIQLVYCWVDDVFIWRPNNVMIRAGAWNVMVP